ncbi:uncharacterized protein LOC115212865 [Octopus sinensis]|uniref:Uncharacterized protein LOC115212865 n=1 Tax=Octopus sinensis TaxID=2607531 RepID=A0A6P7SH30_9MOLL|nr:uncharacterized protein LOC115212865 [Octopus sinensis]
MAPPALINPFSSYEACHEMAGPEVCQLRTTTTPREGDFTYCGSPESSKVDSLIDFIAKLSVVHLQRHMLFMQLNCGDCTHSNISRILNTKNIEMNRQHAKSADGGPIADPVLFTPISDDLNCPPFDLAIEYDSLISESNSLENPSDEEVFPQESEYDWSFSPSNKSPMNSTNLDSFSDLHSSVHDGQDSDDDGHFSFDDASSEENWDFNSDPICNGLPCTKDVPFWKTVFQLVDSDDEDDDECDSDDCVSDDDCDDDILFSDTPCFSFNKLFENTQNTKTETTDSVIPNSVGKANHRWNQVYPDTDTQHQKAAKVRFAADEKLETKHLMFAWSYAYQAARKGEWVQIHIDSERFRCRIENTEQVLKPILDPCHRLKILALRKKYEHY